MDAAELYGLLYTTLSEEPFKNQRICIKNEKDNYTISYHVSQYFGMLIGETMTCLSYHQNERPKVLNDD